MSPHKYKDLRLTQGPIVPAGLRTYTSHYRILEEDSNKIFERRDVLMEEIPGKTMNKTSVSGSSASPCLTAWTDGDKQDGAMNMLDAEVPSGDEYAPQQSSESDGAPEKEAVHDAEDGDDDDDNEDAAAQEGHQVLPESTTESDDDGAQAPRRSKRKPAPKVTWWRATQRRTWQRGHWVTLSLPGT